MRVAVVGCGSIGRRHALNLVALGHHPWIYDTRPVERPSPECTVTNRLDDAAMNCEAALICTPARTHMEVVRALLDADYRGPLFVEKPLATSVGECEVFRHWLHPVVMVGYNWRFHEEVMRWLAGPNLWQHFECYTDMATWPGVEYGEPIAECSHELDLVLSRGGMFGAAGTLFGPDGMWLQFQGVSSSVVDLRWKCGARRRLTIKPFRPLAPVQFIDFDMGSILDQSYRDELAHFLRAVEGGPIAPGCTLEEGIAVLDVVEQARRLAG